MKIESVTWMEVTKKYKKKSCYINVIIVIDLKLRNLEGYNNWTIPFFGQWTLLENYTFMYATADTSDKWCNKMIKQCDKTALQRLKEIVTSLKIMKKSKWWKFTYRIYFAYLLLII